MEECGTLHVMALPCARQQNLRRQAAFLKDTPIFKSRRCAFAAMRPVRGLNEIHETGVMAQVLALYAGRGCARATHDAREAGSRGVEAVGLTDIISIGSQRRSSAPIPFVQRLRLFDRFVCSRQFSDQCSQS